MSSIEQKYRQAYITINKPYNKFLSEIYKKQQLPFNQEKNEEVLICSKYFYLNILTDIYLKNEKIPPMKYLYFKFSSSNIHSLLTKSIYILNTSNPKEMLKRFIEFWDDKMNRVEKNEENKINQDITNEQFQQLLNKNKNEINDELIDNIKKSLFLLSNQNKESENPHLKFLLSIFDLYNLNTKGEKLKRPIANIDFDSTVIDKKYNFSIKSIELANNLNFLFGKDIFKVGNGQIKFINILESDSVYRHFSKVLFPNYQGIIITKSELPTSNSSSILNLSNEELENIIKININNENELVKIQNELLEHIYLMEDKNPQKAKRGFYISNLCEKIGDMILNIQENEMKKFEKVSQYINTPSFLRTKPTTLTKEQQNEMSENILNSPVQQKRTRGRPKKIKPLRIFLDFEKNYYIDII